MKIKEMKNMIENEARKYIKDTLTENFKNNKVMYVIELREGHYDEYWEMMETYKVVKHISNDIDEITSKVMEEIRNSEGGSYEVTIENDDISIDFLSWKFLNCYKDYSINEIFENKNISILDKYYIINKVVAC